LDKDNYEKIPRKGSAITGNSIGAKEPIAGQISKRKGREDPSFRAGN